MDKLIYQGEIVRVINNKTGVVTEHQFNNPVKADYYEVYLELMNIHFQRWSKGEMLYESWGI